VIQTAPDVVSVIKHAKLTRHLPAGQRRRDQPDGGFFSNPMTRQEFLVMTQSGPERGQ
jgi:hypothetical protein